MEAPLDTLKNNFINVYSQRLEDFKLAESEIQVKLCNKYDCSEFKYRLSDIITDKIKELCYFNSHPKGFEKFTDKEKEEHNEKELEAIIKERNQELFVSSEFSRLSDHFYLEAGLCDKDVNYAKITKNLWGYTGNGIYYLFDEKILKILFDHALDLYLVNSDRFSEDIWFEYSDVLISAVNYFKLNYDADYAINIAEISLKDHVSINIHARIESLIKEIGGIQTLNFIFDIFLNKIYNPELDRYFICRDKKQTGEKSPTPIPYNY
jgi:hypothetical protein